MREPSYEAAQNVTPLGQVLAEVPSIRSYLKRCACRKC